jgi:hypothetical protein
VSVDQSGRTRLVFDSSSKRTRMLWPSATEIGRSPKDINDAQAYSPWTLANKATSSLII